jgi:glycosyltransferase involved in cell wall biosynthesis
VRVAHVVVAGELGGAERMLVDLAGATHHTGASHTIAVMTPNPAVAAVFRSAGLDVHDHGRVREDPLAYLAHALGRRAVNWLIRLFRDRRTQVVHLHTFGSQVIGTRAARAAGIPVLRTEHSTRVFDHRVCWPLSRWSLERCARSVCVSAAVRATALARAPWARTRLHVIRNGVDLARFSPSPVAPLEGPLALALIGRLEPRKGADLALRAVARVPGARLELAGDGASRPALERLAHRLGIADRVRFLGHLADVRPVIARAHAVLCSSRSEGLGLALLEAMAMARPIVGFRVGGVVEIVTDELTGRLTAEPTPAALAAVLVRTAREREQLAELGRAARAWVERHASSRAMCEAYGRIYAELSGAR